MCKDKILHFFTYDRKKGILLWRNPIQITHKVGRQAGSKDTNGHLLVTVNSKKYAVHRLIWIIENGNIDDNLVIDHINHNRLDNRIENLRLVTQKDNMRNMKMLKSNTSGFTGVVAHRGKWCARIKVNGIHKYLGIYDKKEDAIIARKQANDFYGFHKNHGKK